jgi:hypothetical protein
MASYGGSDQIIKPFNKSSFNKTLPELRDDMTMNEALEAIGRRGGKPMTQKVLKFDIVEIFNPLEPLNSIEIEVTEIYELIKEHMPEKLL